MKKLFTILTVVLLTIGTLIPQQASAQAPEKMSYQAVVRNSSNSLISNTKIGMRISILKSSASGTAVYVETQKPTTNANGLVSIEIGAGTKISGVFSTIDWAKGSYFIKTEIDPSGGTNYTTIVGTSQLLSVPYALHAKTSDTSALAYGFVDATGTLKSGTSNIAVKWDAAFKWYQIKFKDEIYMYNEYVTVVTPISTALVSTSSSNGALLVNITNLAGTKIQSGFQFVVYKP